MLWVRFLSRLPLGLLYFLSKVLALFAYYVVRYRREVVRKNLTTAFPEKSKKELLRTEKRFYRHFLQLFAEFIKAWRFSKRDWQERTVLKNPEVLTACLEKGISVVLLQGHTANWEWPFFSIGRQINYPFEFMYQPLSSKRMDQIMLALRTKHGGTAVASNAVMRELIKRRKRTRIIGMAADQLPHIDVKKHWFPFLNKETAFHVGGERIAISVGYAAVYLRTERLGKGRYELSFEEISVPPYQKVPGTPLENGFEITRKFVEKLEQNIRTNPPDYLWSHRRWKYSRAEDEEKKIRLSR